MFWNLHWNKTKLYIHFQSGVYWNDSTCSFKAVLLTGPIVRFLAAEQLLTPTLATDVMIAVLQGLQNHGQHDANQVKR